MTDSNANRNELRLISKIIGTQDVNTAIRSGITPNVLLSPIARTMFQDILNYFHNREHYGRVPPHHWMKSRFPGSYHKRTIKETTGELCAAIREVAMATEIDAVIEDIGALKKTNPTLALEKMRAAVLQIGRMAPKSTDRTLANDADDIIARARARRDTDTILGIPFPWDELNDLTQGMQSEDFIVLFGRPKSMKSWVAGKMCSHAYLHGNCRVLVYSCEMSTALFEDRVSCTIHDLNYEWLKQGTLSNLDWDMYQEALYALKEDELSDAVNGRHRSIKFCSAFDDPTGGGVAHLLAKAEEFDPDLIIVDSFYKMKDDRSGKRSVKWDVQYNIVQDLKGITQLLHIPVIGVTQRHRQNKEEEANGDDEDLGDIAYADAVGQEADAIYRIRKDGMLADGRTVQLRISMAGSRETRVGGFLLHVTPSTSWRLDSWLDENGKEVDDPLKERGVKDPSKRGGSLNASRRGNKKKAPEEGAKDVKAGKVPADSADSLGIEYEGL